MTRPHLSGCASFYSFGTGTLPQKWPENRSFRVQNMEKRPVPADSGNFPFAAVETVTVYMAVRWRKWSDISRSLLYGLLILDDWGLATLNDANRRDVLELLEDRHGRGATIVTSQFPVDHWHEALGDPTLADATLTGCSITRTKLL